MTTQSSALPLAPSSSAKKESERRREIRSKHKEDFSSSRNKNLGEKKIGDHEIANIVPSSNQFQRIWTLKDEIELLKALIKFQKKAKGSFLDKKRFFKFLEDSLEPRVRERLTIKSLSSKIDRLRKKYLNLDAKRQKGECGHVFSFDQDNEIYDLGRMIWGVTEKKEIDVDVDLTDDVHEKTLSLYPFLDKNASKYPHVIALIPNQKQMSELISSPKAKEFDERWKEQQLKEDQIEWERVELVRDCTRLLKEELHEHIKP